MTKEQTYYVVTRNSRRIEEDNYLTKEDANARAEQLVQVLKKWKDPDEKRVSVVQTTNPSKIR